MEALIKSQYIVYGVGFGVGRIDRVGITTDRQNLQTVAATTRSEEPEIFELEVFASLEQAQEALEFWMLYLSFLGLTVLADDCAFECG